MARKFTTQTQKAIAATQSDVTALYIRVSTDKQVDEGFSLDAQQTRLGAYCVANGWDVNPDHIYIDAGVSGKSASRPNFDRMLTAAATGTINRVVAVKLDRLARNTKNFLSLVEDLENWNCDIVLIKESFDTSTPNGKFALTMFAAIAELEASQITERVMSGKRQKASDGGYNGAQCPLGYDYDSVAGEFTTNDNAATVTRIFEQFNAGVSMTKIAAALVADGVPTKRGGRWYTGTVRYVLTNGFYAGITQYDGEEIDGAHESIITKNVYEMASNRLRNQKRGPKAA